MKGGQITISQCSDFSTSGRNFSKNAVVSAGVLYIFQLPAMTGFLIKFAPKNWCRVRSPVPKLAATVWPISESDARNPRSTPRRTLRPQHQQRNVLARVVGARNGGIASVVGGENGGMSSGLQRGAELRQPGSNSSSAAP